MAQERASFATHKTHVPFWKKPGTVVVIVALTLLLAAVAFAYKAPDETLVARIRSRDATSVWAAKILANRGVKLEATRDALLAVLVVRDGNPAAPVELRAAAAEALGSMNDPLAASNLAEATRDAESLVRGAAVRGLGRMRVEAVVLIASLADPEVQVRVAAAEALGAFGDERAIDPLIEHLGDNTAEVREACHKALQRLTKQTFGPEKASWSKWRESR